MNAAVAPPRSARQVIAPVAQAPRRRSPGYEARTATARARVTPSELEKFNRLGGAEWLRKVLALVDA